MFVELLIAYDSAVVFVRCNTRFSASQKGGAH
jgi:hypothetical protein